MRNLIQRLRWPDYLILAVLVAFFGYIWFTIEGTLNYKWRWELIPGYIIGYHTGREEYFANLLLQGLVATIRISIYASILAVILGTFLGIARCSGNLTIRMLARTYLEFLRNIPPVVVMFIFFFFLSQQLIDALNLARWSRGVARSEDAWIWEIFFGEMRRFPSLVSGVLVLALFRGRLRGRNRARRHPVDPPRPARGRALHRHESLAGNALHRAAPGVEKGHAASREPVHHPDQGQLDHLADLGAGADLQDGRTGRLVPDDLRGLDHHRGLLLRGLFRSQPTVRAVGKKLGSQARLTTEAARHLWRSTAGAPAPAKTKEAFLTSHPTD
jgi:His/Glu/Gln/Arg/opine family amino acid ABC transporter permease subunit